MYVVLEPSDEPLDDDIVAPFSVQVGTGITSFIFVRVVVVFRGVWRELGFDVWGNSGNSSPILTVP